ncbi:hypothetical protein GMRT_11239 [Giardia muris]|uniref:Uncharacterized protein n=1 Tax=Giardia muris TaxID=5742 RepID=A0A4Z1SR17_GIAMU|nr:hypothetical protein GMRT_21921 [Giardia muris]TNJ28300.1 hypothetical protein GMRT_11239 [Giardia muris]|eukprot:TNJ28296.1 hypothetical protein GMRT_21921 [Giardia muris]
MGVQKAWPSHHLQAPEEALLLSSSLRNVPEDSHLSPLTCGAGCRRADWMFLDHEGMGSEGGLPAQGTGLILLPSTLPRSLAGVRGEGAGDSDCIFEPCPVDSDIMEKARAFLLTAANTVMMTTICLGMSGAGLFRVAMKCERPTASGTIDTRLVSFFLVNEGCY